MEKVKINGIKYEFRCDFAFPEKRDNDNSPAIKIVLIVLKNGELMEWKDFKDSYEGSKISEYIRNTINGQRSFYWNS